MPDKLEKKENMSSDNRDTFKLIQSLYSESYRRGMISKSTYTNLSEKLLVVLGEEYISHAG